MSKTAVDLIEELGGRKVVAERSGKEVGAVDLWKHRNKIPRNAWPEIQKAFPEVSLDLLLEVEASAPAETHA